MYYQTLGNGFNDRLRDLYKSQSTTLIANAQNKLMETHGIDPVNQFDHVVTNKALLESYIAELSQDLGKFDAAMFEMLAEQTAFGYLQEAITSGATAHYAKFSLPVLRKFWPKLVAREVVTVMPIDRPEVMLTFLEPSATDFAGTTYELPDYTNDLSSGVKIPSTPLIGNGDTDLLGLVGLTPQQATLERNFAIIEVHDSASNVKQVNIVPDENGYFSAEVEINNATANVSGRVDYEHGHVIISTDNTTVANQYKVRAVVSTEMNTTNTSVDFRTNKLLLKAKTRTLLSRWTVEAAQDLNALFNIDAQGEALDILSKQVAQDVDREILTDLIDGALMHTNAIKNFSRQPLPGYAFGQKAWFENILIPIAEVSNTILADTNIGAGNTLVCHPFDAVIFQATQRFTYITDGNNSGEHTYSVGNLGNKVWNIFVTPNQPVGTITVALKPQQLKAAVYIYAPYIPLTIIPYPLGNIPTVSLKTRYAKKLIRYKGLGLVNIT